MAIKVAIIPPMVALRLIAPESLRSSGDAAGEASGVVGMLETSTVADGAGLASLSSGISLSSDGDGARLEETGDGAFLGEAVGVLAEGARDGALEGEEVGDLEGDEVASLEGEEVGDSSGTSSFEMSLSSSSAGEGAEAFLGEEDGVLAGAEEFLEDSVGDGDEVGAFESAITQRVPEAKRRKTITRARFIFLVKRRKKEKTKEKKRIVFWGE